MCVAGGERARGGRTRVMEAVGGLRVAVVWKRDEGSRGSWNLLAVVVVTAGAEMGPAVVCERMVRKSCSKVGGRWVWARVGRRRGADGIGGMEGGRSGHVCSTVKRVMCTARSEQTHQIHRGVEVGLGVFECRSTYRL